MDYETTNNIPPQPTEEGNQAIEDIIKRRIRDLQFDDVVRIAPPPQAAPPRNEVNLDQNKAQKVNFLI